MLFRKSIGGCDWRRKSSPCASIRDGGCSAFPVMVAALLLATPPVGVGSTWQGVASSASASASVGATSTACVYEGHLLTDKNWYGYLANVTVMTTGRLTFEFVYPADKCCQNVLFYSETIRLLLSLPPHLCSSDVAKTRKFRLNCKLPFIIVRLPSTQRDDQAVSYCRISDFVCECRYMLYTRD